MTSALTNTVNPCTFTVAAFMASSYSVSGFLCINRAHTLKVPDATNRLHKPSQVMLGKTMTVKRDKVGHPRTHRCECPRED